MESLEIKKYYRWTSGQRSDRVEVYLAESEDDVYFESGRFVKKELLDSQLKEIDETEYHARKTEQDLPPPPPAVPQSIEEWESVMSSQEIPFQESITLEVQSSTVKEKSPVRIILEKQKKLTKLNLNFVLEDLDFPSNKVIEFMSMMFDEDEVVEEITDFVYSQMTQEDIHLFIKNSIKNHILSIDVNQDE
jgi:hypothetical protein